MNVCIGWFLCFLLFGRSRACFWQKVFFLKCFQTKTHLDPRFLLTNYYFRFFVHRLTLFASLNRMIFIQSVILGSTNSFNIGNYMTNNYKNKIKLLSFLWRCLRWVCGWTSPTRNDFPGPRWWVRWRTQRGKCQWGKGIRRVVLQFISTVR